MFSHRTGDMSPWSLSVRIIICGGLVWGPLFVKTLKWLFPKVQWGPVGAPYVELEYSIVRGLFYRLRGPLLVGIKFGILLR